MARSHKLKDFERALAMLQTPMFTVMYADKQGHIMHLFGGRVPVRAQGDWAFWSRPVRGDTSATLWTRTHPYSDLPRVVDPDSSWLQNANDPPWTTTFPHRARPEPLPSVHGASGSVLFPAAALRAHAAGGHPDLLRGDGRSTSTRPKWNPQYTSWMK